MPDEMSPSSPTPRPAPSPSSPTPSPLPPMPSPAISLQDTIDHHPISPDLIPNPATTSSTPPSLPASGSSVHTVLASQGGRAKSQRWKDASPVPSSSGGAGTVSRSYKEVVLVLGGRPEPSPPTVDVSSPLKVSHRFISAEKTGWRLTVQSGPPVLPSHAEGDWQEVVHRRARRAASDPRRWSPKDLQGRCFNCLSPSHFVAACRRPTRCLVCHGFGHRASACSYQADTKKTARSHRARQSSRVPVWQRLTRMQGSSAQGGDFQTFKCKESVWKRISPLQPATGDEYHSPLLLASGSGEAAPPVHRRKRKRRRAKLRQEAAKQQLSPASVSSDDIVAPTALEEITMKEQKNDQQVRPLFPPSCVLEFSAEMAREDAALRKALFITIVGTRPEVLGAEIINEVARSFNVEVGAMSIHQAMPEDFILFLPDERTASRVFNGGSIFRGPQFDLVFKRWTRCANAVATSLPALINVEIRGIPAHAWSRSTADHLLRDSCIISELHPATAL
jgi:hypothetical protein